MPTQTDPNKIEYGLANIFFAPLTKTTNASGTVTYTYDTPVALVGAQSMTREPQGESSTFYADDVPYFTTTTNNGYTGELTFIKMTDQIRQLIFKEEIDDNGLMVERSDVLPAEGALLFQCKGDAKNTRHVMYDVTFGRGSEEINTKEDTISPTTATLTYTAVPIEYNGKQITKGKANQGVGCYENFFESVVLPSAGVTTE